MQIAEGQKHTSQNHKLFPKLQVYLKGSGGVFIHTLHVCTNDTSDGKYKVPSALRSLTHPQSR